MSAQAKPDFIFDNIGHTGKWQVRILILICLSKIPVGFHQLATVFLAPPAKVHCVDPDNSTDACSPACKEFEYDRSVFEHTAIMEWDLVCGQKHLVGYAQTIFMMGILLGNIFFGIWSDKQGRRTPLLVTIILQLVAGCAAAIAPWFWLFCILRFLLAFAIGGMMLVTFCILMEIIGPKKREVYNGILFQLPFNFGHCLLPVIAYFIRNFRAYQFVLSIYSVILLSFFCLVPESPRWLMASGRIDESVAILEKAARLNKTKPEAIRPAVEAAYKNQATAKNAPKGNVTDLLKTSRLRRNTLCIFFNWFAWGFNFYGVSQYIGVMSGDIFTNVTISALFGIPGVLLAAPVSKTLGRKPALCIANGCVLTAMGVFIFVPESLEMARVILASIGVFGGAMAFTVTYIYTAELFPTLARNAGIGFASMLARVGAMAAANVAGLADYEAWVPPLFFTVISFCAVSFAQLLPETKGEHLAETIEDAENLGVKK